jgi:hypothetical protein
MESALCVAVGNGQFGNPERGSPAFESWPQKTGLGQQTKKTKCVCSELQVDCEK